MLYAYALHNSTPVFNVESSKRPPLVNMFVFILLGEHISADRCVLWNYILYSDYLN